MNSPGSEADKSAGRGLIQWFINNKVAANILMLFFVVGGLISVGSMRTQTLPDIDPYLITVSVVYPGATPNEVADSITRRVEESLKGIDGVKRIASTASEGVGIINVNIMDLVDADEVYNRVETAVNSLQDFPPEDAERPVITHVRPTPQILRLAVHGKADEATIKYWAENLEEEIRLLPGVTSTSLSGVRDYQISIEVREEDLRKYDLSFDRLAQIVRSYSADIPAGTIESEAGDILLRVQDKRYLGVEFEDIVVATLPDGASLRLGDIANVVDGFEDQNIIGRFNGEPSAFIEVMRNESTDTLSVTNVVLDYIEDVSLPAGMTLTVQQNETTILQDRISLMLRNAIIGFVLVFVILTLFLDLKLAFWTSAAIPISFLGGLILLYAFGLSINMISLFAMIVVLGIVVDDGIVTGEAIYEAQQKSPNDPDAVRRGVMEVIAPVTIGVATTMAAFAPLSMSTGTLGQIIKIAPICVIAILFISLIEAYFILPSHLSHPGSWSRGFMADIRDRVANKLDTFVEKVMGPIMVLVLQWRYATIAFFIASAIVIVALVQGGIVRFIFFPLIESDRININIEMPIGTPFAVTERTVLEIERHILEIESDLSRKSEYDPFENVVVLIGQQGSGGTSPVAGSSGGSSANNVAQVRIQLVPSDFRNYSAAEIESLIRARIDALPDIERLEIQSSLVGDDPDINLELNHPDDETLVEAANQLLAMVENIKGTVDVTTSFEVGKQEYVFKVNQEGLAVGLNPMELGQQLRSAFFGLEVLRYQRQGSEIVVYLRYPKSERDDIASLGQTRIRLANGNTVPLLSVAEIVEQNGFSKIETVNGRHVVSVLADVDTAVSTPTEVMSLLQNETLPQLADLFPGLSYSFEGESREQQEDVASLARNMSIAAMLIFILLGAQLRSYVQPFIVMVAIPFGACGAVLGHLILGHDLTFISLFGMVALSGIVVNDSVVLVDYLNTHARSGKDLHESIVLAVKRRFRPILLTTLSTCMGLLPILTETSLQAQFLIPMVVSLAWGLIFSTIVILFLVPCLIAVSADLNMGKHILLRKLHAQMVARYD